MKSFIQNLRKSNALILDTETTGLDDQAEVLQIGIVTLDGETVFNAYVRPVRAQRWDEAQRVHGIAWSDVQDAPTMGQLAPELRAIMHGRLVAVYNAKFDTRLLWQSIRAGKASSSFNWLHDRDWHCVMDAYAAHWDAWNRCYGSYRWQSLPVARSKPNKS